MLGKLDINTDAAWKKSLSEVNLLAMARHQIQSQVNFVEARSEKVGTIEKEARQISASIKVHPEGKPRSPPYI